MKFKLLHSYNPRFFVLLILLVNVLNLTMLSTVGHGQGGDWAITIEKIKTDYYTRHQPQKAIQNLEEAINSQGNSYSQETLTDILSMVKDYFTKAPDNDRFQKLIYSLLEPDRINRIKDYFRGTSLAKSAALAQDEFMRPVAARIKIDANELEIGQSTKITYSATNARKLDIGKGNLEIKLAPEGLAHLDGNMLVAEKAGTVTLSAMAPDGSPLEQRQITIKGGLAISITPDYKQLSKGKEVTFEVMSNKPFDQFPIEISKEPVDMISINEVPGAPNANKKVVRAKALKPGTGFLLVTNPNGSELSRATIYIPAQAPSKVLPSAGIAVTVGAAVWAVVSKSSADDKYNQYKTSIETPGTSSAENSALYDDYKSKLNKSRLGFAVTGIAAAGTGYLWYRYFKLRDAYSRQAKAAPVVSMMIGNKRAELIYSCSF